MVKELIKFKTTAIFILKLTNYTNTNGKNSIKQSSTK